MLLNVLQEVTYFNEGVSKSFRTES
jgi:hypothetical protein